MLKQVITAAFAVILTAAAGNAQENDASGKTSQKQAETEKVDYRKVPLLTITGDTTSLADFDGKAILIVNTASKCGYTPQYEGLQELYEKYKDSGLVVIGFPANNFKNQEPGTNEEIQTFCSTEYGVTFPMMSKISVKGDDKHPLYVYLTEQSPYPGEITWNFNKFLLDRNGKVIARFDSKVTPMSDQVQLAVYKALYGG
jgi:glutathione peroxidase